MKLSKAFAIGCVIGFGSCVSFNQAAFADMNVAAEIPEKQVAIIMDSLQAHEIGLVELLAADFFETELSETQQQRILESQARRYRGMSGEDKNRLRSKRRAQWREKSEQQREEVVLSNGTPYSALSDGQKAPFRLYAIEKLGLRTSARFGTDQGLDQSI